MSSIGQSEELHHARSEPPCESRLRPVAWTILATGFFVFLLCRSLHIDDSPAAAQRCGRHLAEQRLLGILEV